VCFIECLFWHLATLRDDATCCSDWRAANALDRNSHLMSAWGQSLPKALSAICRFTPSSDDERTWLDVSNVPIADLMQCTKRDCYSINSSARDRSVGGRVRPSAFGGLLVDQELEFGGLIDRDVARLTPSRICCTCGPCASRAPQGPPYRPSVRRHRRSRGMDTSSHAVLLREFGDQLSVSIEVAFTSNQNRVRPLPGHLCKDTLDLRGVPALGSIEISEIPNRLAMSTWLAQTNPPNPRAC